MQEEIKIIKLQLENLPGYAIGQVPPHLLQLKQELEKTFKNLEIKNELLISSMQKNFGQTHQQLQNFKLPPVLEAQGAQGRKSLIAKQTDVMGTAELYS